LNKEYVLGKEGGSREDFLQFCIRIEEGVHWGEWGELVVVLMVSRFLSKSW
jgi:hypothetical protein